MKDDNESFNDVMNHFDKIEGNVAKKVNIKSLPKPIKFIGFVIIGFIVLSAITIIVVNAI